MSIPLPGPGRITVALLAVIPAAMGYPWHSVSQRYVLGTAIALIVLLFAWWRGLYLTTILWRRPVQLIRARRGTGASESASDSGRLEARTTVVLRLLDGSDPHVPLGLIASYQNRYGLSCERVRVTSRDTAAGRTTWIGLTMPATANLPALQSRSPRIPLRETAQITLRRLADQLREQGWSLTMSDLNIPDLLGPAARERWRTVTDDGQGYVSAYSIAADSLSDTLTELWSRQFTEVWTALEISERGIAAGAVVRTDDMPAAMPPIRGLTSALGTQWDAVRAMSPESTKPLVAEASPIAEQPSVPWPTAMTAVSS